VQVNAQYVRNLKVIPGAWEAFWNHDHNHDAYGGDCSIRPNAEENGPPRHGTQMRKLTLDSPPEPVPDSKKKNYVEDERQYID
jgi:hypothetical protein